jgi:two-component system, chemotaxis family, protein-glutamate methylesterase/glutaminase
MKEVRALILDDSSICRDRLREILSRGRDIVVVGEAENGDRVLELIRRTNPTILVVDLQMPGTGGLETIERVMANHPLPILVLTGQPSAFGQKAVFESIRRGALDLCEKPQRTDPAAEKRLYDLVRELSFVPVVRHMAGSGDPKRTRVRVGLPSSRPPRAPEGRVPVVAIGASAGGPMAVALVVAGLPVVVPAAVAIVQHLPKGFAAAFAEFLRARTLLPVTLVTRRTPIRPGQIFLATDDRHLVACDPGHFGASDEPEMEGHRPAVDALFLSLAKNLRARSCGVVMSGIGRDGTVGLLELKKKGALTLAQDAKSAGVFGMPKAALEAKAAVAAHDPAGLTHAVLHWANEQAEALGA